MNNIVQRKLDHIELVLDQQQALCDDNPFDAVYFEHNALPEQDLDKIDLSTSFLGHRLKLPLMVSSMTGGPRRTEVINARLAMAAQELGIPLAVGSQRIALQSSEQSGFGRQLRKSAPDIPLFANIGAAQLRDDFGIKDIQRAVDMIDANALILHFNPLQEALQQHGDVRWRGILNRVTSLTKQLSVPVIAKEVGMGISSDVARLLIDAGITAIDVAGKGGTNFKLVEGQRSRDAGKRSLANLFADWGIPTPEAILTVREALPDIPLIASGGIRHGLDAAKALALGADLVGQAGALLPAATTSTEAVIDQLKETADALRLARFCSTKVSYRRT